MALLGTNTDYTNKDFDSLRARLISLVGSAFPEWTDFNVANIGNILVELVAHVGDVLTFYQDYQARESRITQAQLRKSLLGMCKLLGYVPRGANAATAELTITLSSVPVGNVTIQAGDTFRTAEITNPLVFQSLISVVIPGGTNPPVVIIDVENSESKENIYTSTGLADQEYLLSWSPYLDNSAVVIDDDSILFEEVDNFLSSTSSDRHYTITIDESDRATIRFGNGVAGKVPVGTIQVSYKTGGGAAGNVETGAIQRADKSYVDSVSNSVRLTVTNVSPASGGEDRETISQIRQFAPESLRTLTRTVSREDYETNARRVTGVARALMLTSNELEAIDENAGLLYVVPTGGGTPTTTLKNSVYTMVTETYPNTLTFFLEVKDPYYKTIDVQATVFLLAGHAPAVVDGRIRLALQQFFAIEATDGTPNDSINFGYYMQDSEGNPVNEIPWSDVFDVVKDCRGVRKLGDSLGSFLLNGVRSDVEVEPYEFPVLGTITLINGETGSPLVS
jgi:hypothetical protein